MIDDIAVALRLLVDRQPVRPCRHHRAEPATGRERHGHAASDLIDWAEDPAIAAIVTSWPARFETRRAHALGLRAEQSFDDIVREYLASA